MLDSCPVQAPALTTPRVLPYRGRFGQYKYPTPFALCIWVIVIVVLNWIVSLIPQGVKPPHLAIFSPLIWIAFAALAFFAIEAIVSRTGGCRKFEIYTNHMTSCNWEIGATWFDARPKDRCKSDDPYCLVVNLPFFEDGALIYHDVDIDLSVEDVAGTGLTDDSFTRVRKARLGRTARWMQYIDDKGGIFFQINHPSNDTIEFKLAPYTFP